MKNKQTNIKRKKYLHGFWIKRTLLQFVKKVFLQNYSNLLCKKEKARQPELGEALGQTLKQFHFREGKSALQGLSEFLPAQESVD